MYCASKAVCLKFQKRAAAIVLMLSLSLLSACATTPPSNPENLCSIFSQHRSWYKAAKSSVNKWGGNIHVPMAIIYQESSYRRSAKPRMRYFLGIIPTGRSSSAYGYSQALESTWRAYEKEVGSRFKSRDNFADSIDFILWYMEKTYAQNGVSKWDAYSQYLNYHEGQGGYSRGTYKSKAWLLATAQKVANRAQRYATQLSTCT